MKECLRIGIVEDEILTTEFIGIHLRKMGHEVVGTFTNFNALFADLPCPKPDLFLVDIRLKGKKNGIDVARELSSSHGIPFIFLTSHTNPDMVRESMGTGPVGYVTKPFSYDDLFIAIELAKAKIAPQKQLTGKVKIKNGRKVEWIDLEQILFLEANRAYVTIHMTSGNCILRQSLGSLLESFPKEGMVRVHRSFAVNPHKVKSVGANSVLVAGKKIPLGPGYREAFQEALRSLHG